MVITGAVEGPSDEAMLRRIVDFAGGELGQIYGRNGKRQVLLNLKGYNHAARFSPWIVLVDLDRDYCPVVAKQNWLPEPAPMMCFRIAVRELEAWLLADAERFSSFFGVSFSLITQNPDLLEDPKLELINLVRRSRRKAIREDIVPDPRLGQTVGPAYTTWIINFINDPNGWRIDEAAENSASLRRSITAIRQLILACS